MNLPRTTYLVILSGSLAWCAAILLAPHLATASAPFAEFLYRGFHHICHQLPERSFHLLGEKLAACSRCSSIYFAFLLGVVIYPLLQHSITPLLQHSRGILVAALLPMLIDVALEFLGIHESTYATRTITGIIFGIVIPFFVLPAAIEGVQQLVAPKRITFREPS
jgi:uncharacterized membrane protein